MLFVGNYNLKGNKMSRLIIHNESSKTDSEVLWLVKEVIDQGRISNSGKQYCYVTTFTRQNIIVCTRLNKCSDVFYVKDIK